MTSIPIALRFLIAAFALLSLFASIEAAHRRRCPLCGRSFAIWPIRGKLNRWLGVCRRCYTIHRNRARALAR